MQEASQLETMLQQKIEVPANENLPLLCRFKVISSCLKKYREEAKDRKAEVAVLKAKELSLCKGKIVFINKTFLTKANKFQCSVSHQAVLGNQMFCPR